MRYPENFVHEYGAKAGILIYVSEHLPDIPQVPMMASRKGENTLNVMRRIGRLKFGPPYLVRSSAVAELYGYEGELSTLRATSSGDLPYLVDIVRGSPRILKSKGFGADLPDTISAIIAEVAKSKHIGTYIKHPNIPDLYFMSITPQERDMFGPRRFAYTYTPQDGVELLKKFTNIVDAKYAPKVEKSLALVASRHDRVASLPEMDPEWAYQIEFGLNPTYLFQVRPFKRCRQTDFKLPERDRWYRDIKPIVIGITNSEGIMAKVIQLTDDYGYERGQLPRDSEPVVIVDKMRTAKYAKHLSNHMANLFSDSFGFLEHDDIAAMRQAQVTALYQTSPDDIPGGIHEGNWLKIISDGSDILIENLS